MIIFFDSIIMLRLVETKLIEEEFYGVKKKYFWMLILTIKLFQN